MHVLVFNIFMILTSLDVCYGTKYGALRTLCPDVQSAVPSTTNSENTSPYSSTDDSPSTSSSSTDTTTVIIAVVVVGVILGILLLFVACAIFALTFAVLFKRKRKPHSPLRIHSTRPSNNTANMYETSLEEGFKKMDRGADSMDMRHCSPKDPEYATLSEWKDMAKNQEKMNNPFYSSAISLETRKGAAAAVQVPQLEWSGSAWDAHALASQTPPHNKHLADPSMIPPQLMQTRRHTKSSSLKSYANDSTSSPKPPSFIYRDHLPCSSGSEEPLPPLPSSQPPPCFPLSKSRPSLPPKHSKMKLVPTGSGSTHKLMKPVETNPPSTPIDGSVAAGKSLMVHNNHHRAVGKSQSNEIINNEYAVTGMKLNNLEN